MFKSPNQMLQTLKKKGFFFKSFHLSSLGNFTPEDCDWNYKDTLHVPSMHHPATGLCIDPFVMSDNAMTSFLTQKIFGFFNFTYLMTQYDSGTNNLSYIAQLPFCFMLITTEYYKNKSKTKVVTKYNIAASKLFITIFYPLLKWGITRNYAKLMDDDIAIRERKGWLRKRGMSFFMEKKRYTYIEVNKMDKNNCIYEPSMFNSSQASKVLIIKKNSYSDFEFLTGISDPWGLRGLVVDNNLTLYPRMCHHEGASLDNAILNKNIASCPWHGKKIKPIHQKKFSTNKKLTLNYNGKIYNFNFNNGLTKLTII